MKVDIQIRLSENYKTQSEFASGWAEVEDTIKFPIKVRRYTDKTDGKEKMFVSYPQRKIESGYEEIVHPQDTEIRSEIHNKVMEELKKQIAKGIHTSPVTDVRVSLLEKERNMGSIKIKAVASIKICGFWINGITVKESPKGIFVQMPQYKSNDGQYKDIVYGISSMAQIEIKKEVEYAYQKGLEKQKETEKNMLKENDTETYTIEESEQPVITEKTEKEFQKNVQDVNVKVPKL